MRRTKPKRLPYYALVGVICASLAPSASAAITRKDAYNLGVKGYSASYILRKAFPGITIVRQKEAPVRVLLVDDVPAAIVAGQVPLLLTNARDASVPPAVLPAKHRFLVKRGGNMYTITDLDAPSTPPWKIAGRPVFDAQGAGTGMRLVVPSVRMDARFRGKYMMVNGLGTNAIRVINVLDVEPYLLGTLPGDMPPAWGVRAPQTLRAGAVALRSWALTRRKLPTADYDFDGKFPKYLGLDGERTATTKAVIATRYVMLRRNGYAYPASFSGGPVMGSGAFVPRPGKPVPVAFGPEKPVTVDPGSTPVNKRVLAAMNLALSFRGTPYRWGGSAPGGFDCSGLLYYVFGQQGIRLPRVAEEQARVGKPIRTRAELLPGDAVFFANSSGYIGHIGIYIGNNQMVHAPHSGDVVKISSLLTPYYMARFAGGRRYG